MKVPHHLAVIMDGNHRWAVQRHLTGYQGHLEGQKTAFKLIEWCLKKGIPTLTLFVLSQDNLKRRARLEIKALFEILSHAIQTQLNDLIEHQISLRILGDVSVFPESLAKALLAAESETAEFDRMQLNLALNYSGHWHVAECVRHFVSKQFNDKSSSTWPSNEAIESWMQSSIQAPDLLIRTGQEQRLSNFMLWHCAYTELFFSEVLWPDFKESHLDQAFEVFNARQRRFGGREMYADSSS
tara:strand:+ start:449 stop:1171 length:723 start_codon:yes stop_codon:yes gene_type:complete